jgi:hypothetical protein
MVSTSLLYCDCCGLPLSNIPSGGDCPRCGYPVDALKEEHFLQKAVGDLKRVAAYGGAGLTVAQLIQRYQVRLNFLQQQKALAALQKEQASRADHHEHSTLKLPPVHAEERPRLSPIQTRAFAGEEHLVVPSVTAPVVPALNSHTPPARVFSLKSFLEDQTINIVASLGAFLILVGSLSFVATTSNLVLSFFTMFLVHIVFGGVGILSYRFSSFRVVAVIYTAIFALLVPLVGFSGYRLVSGNLLHLETPLLVAIAAIYAAVIYGMLAVYQRFSPFAYLSMVALVVADIALAVNFHLASWWWPNTLMVLAFLSLSAVSVHPRPRLFSGSWSILRDPVRVLMYVCSTLCGLGIIFTFSYALELSNFGSPRLEQQEVRLALSCMLMLLLGWSCLFIWRTRQTKIAVTVPFLFLAGILSVAYTTWLGTIGYVIVLIVVALLYHGLVRFTGQYLRSFHQLTSFLDALALILAALIPFVAFPSLSIQVLLQAYNIATTPLLVTGDNIIGLVAVIGGIVLTLSVIEYRTGLQREPMAKQAGWPWLLLLSGFLLNVAFSVAVLWLKIVPVWGFLGLTLALIVLAVATRQWMTARWAQPLDVLALCGIGQTLVLGITLHTDIIILLLLFYAALLHGIVLYQRRAPWLFLSVLLALLALPLLLQRLSALYLVSLALPLIAALQYRLLTYRLHIGSHGATGSAQIRLMTWEWPLLIIGILYGLGFVLEDAFVPVSATQNWLLSAFPSGLEVAIIAVVWYAAAALTRLKWWLVSAVGFAMVALVMPGNSFSVLTWLAPIMALLAFGVSRVVGRDWALPFYATAVFAGIMMGFMGYTHGLYLATTWALLVFAVDIYLVGCAEHESALMWIAVGFAVSSVYCSGLIGGFYRFFPPIIALICVAIGIGIGCLRWLLPAFASSDTTKNKLLRYSLPLYTVAFVAAVLTGIYGLLAGVNNPFYTAIPDALLVYALVAYGVLRFERWPQWQWLVAVFAIWSIVLTTQLVTAPEYLSNGVCRSSICQMQAQNAIYYLSGIVLLTGMLGLLTRFFMPGKVGTGMQAKFVWNWSWYLSWLVAIVVTATWGYHIGVFLPGILGVFILFSLVIMLLERAPEVLLVPVALSAWAISLIHWDVWQQMAGYTLLCVLIFGSQFVWQKLPSSTQLVAPGKLHQILGLGGQIGVVVVIIGLGGLLAGSGVLAHIGAGSLWVLAGLLFWWGCLQSQAATQRRCLYSAGWLLSLGVSWELSALGQTHVDLLTLAPASYLIVVAPFLSRDEKLPYHYRVGQLCAVAGAALLLLPALWLSFSAENLLPTFILAGEALMLLLLGVAVRMRFFVLSGAGLVIVAAMHALFLPSLGLPPSLALTILGATLLAIATALSLVRHHLRALWTRWE